MRKTTNLLLLLFLSLNFFNFDVLAQSDIKMKMQYGVESEELMTLLYFEDIGFSRMSFSGSDLNGKDYQILITKIIDGKLEKPDVIFDSKEDNYFRIKSNNFGFRVLSKTTSDNVVKFQFQFSGFSKSKEYPVSVGNKNFALKGFLGQSSDLSIPVGKSANILTYMMPYKKADGSEQYCEVVQSDTHPEELGKKYKIPTYFLIAIKFQ